MLRRLFNWLFGLPPVMKVEINVSEFTVRVQQGSTGRPQEREVTGSAGPRPVETGNPGDCSANHPSRDEEVLDGLSTRLKHKEIPQVPFGTEKS
jgi:hypothetical protein